MAWCIADAPGGDEDEACTEAARIGGPHFFGNRASGGALPARAQNFVSNKAKVFLVQKFLA